MKPDARKWGSESESLNECHSEGTGRKRGRSGKASFSVLSVLALFSPRSCDVRETEGCDVTESTRESIPGVWRTAPPWRQGNAHNSVFKPHASVSDIQRGARLRVFEDRALRRILRPRGDEVTGGRRELRNLYSSPRIIRIMKRWRVRWDGRVVRMERREMFIEYGWESLKERNHKGGKKDVCSR
jgi:hypothetical protein